MRERIAEFNNENVTVWVVAPSTGEFIHQFVDSFGPFPFPIVGDPDRIAYKEFDHRSVPKWKLYWIPIASFLSGKMKDFLPKDSQQRNLVMKAIRTQDIAIQGGTYLYSKDGQLFWKHVDASPEDHARLETVLDVIQKKQSS